MDIACQKSRLREDIRRRLQGLPEKERAAESQSLCRRVLEVLPSGPLAVAAFSSLKGEPDLSLLLRELLKREVQLFFPRVESGTIVFRRIADLRTLQRGAFNILEPPRSAALLDPATLSIALIPGVAFDRAGNRLGRGNGGYDHWIAAQRRANPGTIFFGVCFEAQLVQEVPISPHDERVDAVVMARGLLHCLP